VTVGVGETVRLAVPLPGPVDVAASVEFLRRNGDDLLDRWDGDRMLRVLTLDGHRVPVAMRPTGDPAAPCLDVMASDLRGVGVGALCRAVADQFAVPPPSWPALLAEDRVLARVVAHASTIRPLALTDPLYSMTRAITAQQVNLRFATAIRGRLAGLLGDPYEVDGATVRVIEPERLAGSTVSALRPLQLSERKATYLIGVATALRDGRLHVPTLAELSDQDVIAELTALHGIGRWTAEWFAVRVLGRPVVVAGDVAPRRAVGRLYSVGMPTEQEVRRLTEHWGDAAHIAQQIVLETCA
jgi:DNA-3-methyladenine glycosylase II